MLKIALVFFVLGLIAMLCGAYGLAGLSVDVGRSLLFVFMVLAIVSFAGGLISGGTPKPLP